MVSYVQFVNVVNHQAQWFRSPTIGEVFFRVHWEVISWNSRGLCSWWRNENLRVWGSRWRRTRRSRSLWRRLPTKRAHESCWKLSRRQLLLGFTPPVTLEHPALKAWSDLQIGDTMLRHIGLSELWIQSGKSRGRIFDEIQGQRSRGSKAVWSNLEHRDGSGTEAQTDDLLDWSGPGYRVAKSDLAPCFLWAVMILLMMKLRKCSKHSGNLARTCHKILQA